jgi:poly(A) polymerase
VVLPALGAALDSWDEPRRRGFFAHLGALDRLVRSGEDVSEAVLLGALLMHIPAGRGDAAAPAPPLAAGQLAAGAPELTGEVDEAVAPAAAGARRGGPERVPGSREADALLASLVQTSRLPRKIAERARLALHAQRYLRDPPGKRRRRGRGLAGQQYFTDAVQLLRIAVEATGEGRDVLERWTEHHGRAEEERAPAREEPEVRVDEPQHPPGPQPDGAQAEAGGDGAAGRRRRRRRGGRRRRRRGVGAPAAT